MSPLQLVRSALTTLLTEGTWISMVEIPFTYQIIASSNPTSYTASGLPTSLTFDTSTGKSLPIFIV